MDPIISGIIIASAASLLNFLTTKLYKRITGKPKNFFWKTQNIETIPQSSTIDFDELKKRTRIVVIDDEEAFPIELFKSEGYSVDSWEKVEDYGKLERGFYDIIVLDIKGVAQHISEDDGLGVLESLKKNNPSQIIIAYSQHSFDLSKSKFWEMADDKISKPSDFLKIKKSIDNLIKTQFRPIRYINSLEDLLEKNKFENKEIDKILRLINQSIISNKPPDKKRIVEVIKDNAELVSQVLSLAKVIMKFF